jgi:hypothetical protein
LNKFLIIVKSKVIIGGFSYCQNKTPVSLEGVVNKTEIRQVLNALHYAHEISVRFYNQ